jgi:mycothiol synthase
LTVVIRGAVVEDAPAITALLEEHALASFGEPEFNEEELRSWFSMPRLRIWVAERDGRLVGYLDIHTEEGGRFEVDARTLEDDVAPMLVATADDFARAHAAEPVLRGYVQGDEPDLRAAFAAADWRVIRHSFNMRIELDGELAEPAWPDGLQPRNFEAGEEERVYEAHMEAFGDHWDFRRQPMDEWRHHTVDHHNFDPGLWWLVEDGGELAALSLNSWHFSGDRQFGWIQILGVRPQWRKRGLATALLNHSFRDFRARGATRVGLGVDAENTTGAVRLYEKVGMRQVRRTDAYEKKL